MGKRGPKMDYPRAARILAHAAITTPKKAAVAFGVTQTSINRWKAALKTDPELAKAYEAEYQRAEGNWRRRLDQATVTAIDAKESLLAECQACINTAIEEGDQDTAQLFMAMKDKVADSLLDHATTGGALMGPSE